MTKFRRPLLAGWLLILALLLSACASPAKRIWLNAPGWNRASLVANTPIVDPVSMALDDAGEIYLFLYGGDKAAYYPRVMALNRRAEVVWDRMYEIALKRPDQSRILWNGRALQLFWLSQQGLYYTQLEAKTGKMAGPPILLSGETQVSSYAVAKDAAGLMTIWYAGSQENPGLYALPPGDLTTEATPVDAWGISPSLRYDDTGTLHASWTRYPAGQNHPQFLYAAYPDGIYVPGQETIVLEPRVGTTRVYGPWLGIDRDYVYLLWTIMPRIGPMAGMAATYHMHFPPGQPASASQVGQLFAPYSYRLTYQTSPEELLKAGPRVLLGPEAYGGNTYIANVAVNPSLAPELAIGFHTNLEYLRRQEQGQVSTLFFQDGDRLAYQQISFTSASSDYPAILSDKAGQLYITWLESGAVSGYDVYFASTAPDIRQALSSITWDDIGRLAAETIFGLLGGVVLVPLALVWMLAPLVLLGLTSVIRRDDSRLTSPGVIVSLAVALAAYWASKLAFMPGIEHYVPFSAWLPFVAPAPNFPLRLGVPILVAGLAMALAWRFTYGGERPSAFFFFIIYAAIDGALTMAVYGPIFYGSF